MSSHIWRRVHAAVLHLDWLAWSRGGPSQAAGGLSCGELQLCSGASSYLSRGGHSFSPCRMLGLGYRQRPTGGGAWRVGCGVVCTVASRTSGHSRKCPVDTGAILSWRVAGGQRREAGLVLRNGGSTWRIWVTRKRQGACGRAVQGAASQHPQAHLSGAAAAWIAARPASVADRGHGLCGQAEATCCGGQKRSCDPGLDCGAFTVALRCSYV